MPISLKNISEPIPGGRVTTLTLETDKPVERVEILSGPEHGHASVNPDASIALVLSGSDHAGPDGLQYRITHADGSTATKTASWTVAAPVQEDGWGQGRHYMLAENAGGEMVVETGEIHRKVHVSESRDALSRADIAALENLPVSAVTADWLIANGEYGATGDMALDTEAAMTLWRALTSSHRDEAVSHWLLFERGHTYDPGRLATSKLDGESPLHPVHFTSWGEGDRPVIASRQYIYQHDESSNIVFSDLTFTGGILSLNAENIIFDDMRVTKEGLNIQHGRGYTLHDSEVIHVVNDPPPGAEFWSGTKAGIFSSNIDGWLIEGTIFHHNGWEDDYRADWSTEGGMPPSPLSHNVYLQNDTTDVTFRDNITAEGASFGAHIRGGGYVEGNLFLDNNVAVDLLGGAYDGNGAIGNFTFFADNVVTSGAHKVTDRFDGGMTQGVTNAAYETTLLDNIIAHLADPDDPGDLAAKWVTHHALLNARPAFFDNTVIHNWIGNDPNVLPASSATFADRNPGGLDLSAADRTTIQTFAADLLGTEPGTIRGLMDDLVARAETARDDTVRAADIVAWFQEGFGFDIGASGPATHRFVPDERGDGVRWDNAINWDGGEVPGFGPGAGDSVELGGNRVQYGGTGRVSDLDLGPDGGLSVNYGRLAVTGRLEAGASGAALDISGAGQFWTDGYADTDRLVIDAGGGRFANTGSFTGLATIMAGGQAQAILATDGAEMVLGAGSVLTVSGSAVRAGFDGNGSGPARLALGDGGTLRLEADAAGLPTIGEFRSGAWDQSASPVRSDFVADGTLEIDLSAYAGGAGRFTLVDADTMSGSFDAFAVTGLPSRLDAALSFDRDAGDVVLDLVAGAGQVSWPSPSDAPAPSTPPSPSEPVEPVEPLDPPEPTSPSEPSEPVQPSEPAGPDPLWSLDAASLGKRGDARTFAHEEAFDLETGTLGFVVTAQSIKGRQGLVSKDAIYLGDGGHLTLWIKDGKILARLQSQEQSYELTGGKVTAGEALPVAVTFGEGGFRLFVDGDLVDQDGYSGGLSGNREPIVIGASQWGSSAETADKLTHEFNGTLSDVALYGEVLDTDVIADWLVF